MKYEEKIPNGKLISIEVLANKGIISNVKITGDFFLHPEESIEGLEKTLASVPLNMGESEIASKIKAWLVESGAQLIGASAEDFARVFKKAVS